MIFGWVFVRHRPTWGKRAFDAVFTSQAVDLWVCEILNASGAIWCLQKN